MENKWQIVLSCLMTVVFGTLFAFQTNPVLLILCGFLITYSNAWLTFSYHAYQTEIFPTHIRARAVGFCYSFSRLSTVFSSILIGMILQYVGSQGVIAFIVLSMLMVMLSVGVYGPKNARDRSGEYLSGINALQPEPERRDTGLLIFELVDIRAALIRLNSLIFTQLRHILRRDV
ncbi:MFS transporter [Pantoea tagorei]